ncbi:MAG: hypothetical protein ABL996_03335 [Micropepsaceae bacterium]
MRSFFRESTEGSVSSRKIIFFELNEVPYRVLDRYRDQHPNSALAKVLGRGQQFETIAADTGSLFPTKTWPTVHRGVTNDQHGLTNFGQDLTEVDEAFPPIWQLLADHGVKVGVFGSLFTFPIPQTLSNYAFYMPDTFASTSDAHPKAFEAFQRFNLSMSRASMRNVSSGIDVSGAAGLVPHLGSLGFTSSTVAGVGRQLLLEQRSPHLKTRRRSYQSVLGFDLFFRQLERQQPGFCTFFTNHVAAAMHRYWAAAFPRDYDHFGLTDEWVSAYRDEIDFAMAQSDRMLAKLAAFVNRHPEYQLMIVTSMGQAALGAEPVTSCVSITDMPRFLRHFGLGLGDYEERPAMAPIFNVVVPEPKNRERLRNALAHLSIDGRSFGKELYAGFFEFAFGALQNYQGSQVVALHNGQLTFAEMGLGNMPHEDGVYLTADHIPQGALIVYDLQKERSDERRQMSTLDIAPTILENFGISRPSYMR